MGTISKGKGWRAPHLSRTQLKYAAAYVLITSVILIFLNLYASSTMQSIIFQSKKAYLEDKVQMVSSAMSEMDSLGTESVRQVLGQMERLNATRILVTNEFGVVIYDTLDGNSAQGQCALLPEIISALEGNDVICSDYVGGVLESRAASPILQAEGLVGCVYLMEYDTSQGGLISALQNNILGISLMLEVAVVLFSLVFSEVFSRKMRKIFASVRIIREGDYTHKMKARGRDELAVLSSEFNELTDRLKESEERRRQFVSDASHELKTPLTSIKLLSDSILQNDMDPETIREFVGDIGNEADRLTRMSQKLLSLTRMAEKTEEEREISDIHETAQKVLRMLAPVAQLQGITLRNETTQGATVLMIEDDLYQILFNLAENGIKYNRPGGELTIGLIRREDDWVLTVEDTGVGIPEEAMAHIFDRFYRVDKARSRQAGGSGLGLSIVHDMVLRNLGTVAVSQRPEGGSCFTVVFPAFDVEEEGTWEGE